MTAPDSGYCDHEAIKTRLLIQSTDSTYDTEVIACGQEASRVIDDELRPYISYAQNVTLLAAGYTECVDSDMGKMVKDDGQELGVLLSFNNTTRVWKVKTLTTVATASEMTIVDGTGSGTSTGSSSDGITETTSPSFVFKTLPLSALIPSVIADICVDIACGLYKQKEMPMDMEASFWSKGIKRLDEFIKQNFFKGVLVI